MYLNDRGATRLSGVATNVVAALCGAGTVWLTGWAVWAIPLTIVGGTVGWFLDRAAGHRVGQRPCRLGYAPPGRPVYRLDTLPAGESDAGGQGAITGADDPRGAAGPPGLVILPRGFDGERLTPDAAGALSAELSRFPTGQRFAVRSWAQAEDSSAVSFAGAYESELNVAADDVLAAIGRVRGSRHSTRVTAYGAAHSAEPGDLAVLVQAMVDADLAGVLFTADPLTGDLSTMTGSMTEGLGESLVSGDESGEFGIPAVVGCGDATARLRTGDRVQVDGAAGEVRVLDRVRSGR